MNRDYRDLCIEMLAEREAELLEQNTVLIGIIADLALTTSSCVACSSGSLSRVCTATPRSIGNGAAATRSRRRPHE